MQLSRLKVLYPEYTPEELKEAQEALDEYLEVAWEIYMDLAHEGRAFDAEQRPPHNGDQRSIPQDPHKTSL